MNRRLETLAEIVRRKSRSGELVQLRDVIAGGEQQFVALVAMPGTTNCADIVLVRDSGEAYLYSERYMAPAYAETAARAAQGDHPGMIAATVRHDSATYPRPTPVETFLGQPFLIAQQELETALVRMRTDAAYDDVQSVRASNGAEYLFSRNLLSLAQAESIAEWLAVGQYDNP